MIAPALVVSATFQLMSAIASVGRVKTASHDVSRRFNALTLGAVAANFAVRYLHADRVDYLIGSTIFTVLTARTLLMLGFSEIEGNTLRRRVACVIAFLVCAVTSVAGQLYVSGTNNAAPACGDRPWLLRRGIKRYGSAAPVHPWDGVHHGHVRGFNKRLGIGIQERGVRCGRNDLCHDQISGSPGSGRNESRSTRSRPT